MKKALFRYADGLWPNLLALAYVATAYPAGLLMIMADSWLWNLPGVLLLGHGMVIAAYLIHECAHNTIFSRSEHNARLGRVLNWLTGGCYGEYDALQHKHHRHHVDKADVVAFDYRPGLRARPRLLRLMRALEWAYVPALDIMMHALQILMPLTKQSYLGQRHRVFMVLLIRGSLFLLLALYSLKAALLYVLAYFLMMHVLRFMDAFQHSYEIFETLHQPRGEEAKRFSREYEHANTYSNLISQRYPWLNLLVLNFCYHNAHHFKQAIPWYQLPALHQQQFGADQEQLVPFSRQLRNYHRYRVQRIDNDQDQHPHAREDGWDGFVGVTGVNFLTAF
jgi:fatty acid desaturase